LDKIFAIQALRTFGCLAGRAGDATDGFIEIPTVDPGQQNLIGTSVKVNCLQEIEFETVVRREGEGNEVVNNSPDTDKK
jgi:hypothetical protein